MKLNQIKLNVNAIDSNWQAGAMGAGYHTFEPHVKLATKLAYDKKLIHFFESIN